MKDVVRAYVRGAFLLCLSIGLVFLNISKAVQAAEPIKIGTIMSITGPFGFIGTPQKEAFTAMIDDLNAKGGVLGRPIELFSEDDQSIPTNAVIAATKLIKDKKVIAICGTSMSDAALAIVPTCEQEKIPFINSGPAKIPFKKWIFSTGPGDVRGASHLLEYAVKGMGAKKLAMLYSADAMGTLGHKVMNDEIGKYPGASFIIQETMEPADTSVVPQLTKIKAAGPDVLILQLTGGMASVIAKNYKQVGMTTQVLGCGSITDPNFYKNGAKFAEEGNWIFLSQPLMIVSKMAPNDPYRKNVWEPAEKLLREKYGPAKEVTMFHGSTFDAFRAMTEALRIAGKAEPAAVRDALEKVRIEGFLGKFACTATDHQAAPVDFMRPMTLKNGEYVPYEK
ncbi:MAG: ABC transporter substrate-binding protein [Syntrophorhabdales bacterium]|jgi:branched-chain amino acid transport system substrate-binding protein